MSRISSLVTVGGVAVIMMCLAIGGLPISAHAQDNSNSTGSWYSSMQNGAVAQRAKRPPLQLAGCWYGALNDKKLGTGNGYLWIVQDNKTLTSESFANLDFPGTSIDGGGNVQGKTNSNRFHIGHHGHQCNASFHGTIDSTSGDLVGKYHLAKKCEGQVLTGTFDFPPDSVTTDCGQ